jgi:clan AA aspartic protease
MMQGVVNLQREATLTVVVGNSNQNLQAIKTVIDTGFTGFLSLPSTIISSLNLPWSASDVVTLGDGSETLFDLFTAVVIWDGQYRDIYIAEAETEPLLGMGCSMVIDYRLMPLRVTLSKLRLCNLSQNNDLYQVQRRNNG